MRMEKYNMKKLLAMLLSMAMILSISFTVMGEEDKRSVKGIISENVLKIEFTEGDAVRAMLGVYDEGALVNAKASLYTDGFYAFELTEEELSKEIRINYLKDNSYEVEIEKAPEVTQTPAPTVELTPAPKPQKTPFPSVYEKEKDSVNAPAVVVELSKVAVDGEVRTELKMMYQGSEMTTILKDGVEIVSAPPVSSGLIGSPATELMSGDVIHFTCNMSGQIRSIELLYRPEFLDYITDGVPMTGLVGTGYDTYHFGAVVGKNKNTLEISDSIGVIKDIDVNEEAFVYKISKGSKKTIVDLEGLGTSAVPKTYIPDDNYDDKNNIIWSGVDEITYALIREVRGTATEIIIFEK